jgi:glycosyltransferase involved in cell wall biosynthesis
MRVLIATPLYPPEAGGPATYSKILEEGLPGEGIEVVLVTFASVRPYPWVLRHIAYFCKVLSAARLAGGVSLILALDPVSVGLPASLAARILGVPFIVKIVGDYAWEQGTQRFGITASLDEFVQAKRVPSQVGALRWIQAHVARSAKSVIVPSKYLKRIITAWGIAPEKISVIYNAMQTEQVGTEPPTVASLPRPLVVSVGRLVPWKHMDAVIDAVAGVRDTSLAIVGDGPESAALTRRAKEALPTRAVLTGRLSHADTLATIHSADAFVLNSSYEGLSHLLIEALSLGVPVIATRVGGNPELIEDEGNGLLVQSGDTTALTHAIQRVLTDSSLSAHLRARAVESAKQFSIPVMVPATAKLLKTLI